jgi:hypothetical protein
LEQLAMLGQHLVDSPQLVMLGEQLVDPPCHQPHSVPPPNRE